MKKRNFKYKNEEEIKAYIADNKLDAQKTDTGLYYLINNEGKGAQPNINSYIKIAYIGYFINGDIFDQNDKLEINLTEVITGWIEGLQLFKEGGDGVLFVPSHLAYGNKDNGSIPAGSVLIFDIHLIAVN
ncbi:peptidylprolyl isomerase [Ancylomarina euxinus]|uniref:Peptidyl-prolyl cis-trans isomerase n=1 Tax=Ancylomarina euxinus TaxID=2283627 RepID=A0A425Y2J9_9BACT|nr:FKBP-type peptidyl-prolyl cis-trans isomerase [Ancylomarina euxinus]MCZ4694984.1 FKBP-type peptidyl-prolyl cis-trans isomerase [Ancylomarina euxinus]MUP14849.1 peptidylprolyl isomerase [Ancylomarina euxinus]RRG22192.1 peptidylprolyl isomerase [Ancylomarina euxinus]